LNRNRTYGTISHNQLYVKHQTDPNEDMEIEESKEALMSKDWNIDNMLNYSKTNFGGTSRRKKSYWTTEGTQQFKKVGAMNKTHDYHNSTSNLHSNQLKLFGLEEDRAISRQNQERSGIHQEVDLEVNHKLLQSFK